MGNNGEHKVLFRAIVLNEQTQNFRREHFENSTSLHASSFSQGEPIITAIVKKQ